jgi:hypothetical protein
MSLHPNEPARFPPGNTGDQFKYDSKKMDRINKRAASELREPGYVPLPNPTQTPEIKEDYISP